MKKHDITNFKDHLKKELKDKQFKKYYDEYGKQLEIAYEILKLRKQKGLSQLELAKRIGTTQGNVARIESGKQNFTTEILQRIASACGRNIKIEFVK